MAWSPDGGTFLQLTAGKWSYVACCIGHLAEGKLDHRARPRPRRRRASKAIPPRRKGRRLPPPCQRNGNRALRADAEERWHRHDHRGFPSAQRDQRPSRARALPPTRREAPTAPGNPRCRLRAQAVIRTTARRAAPPVKNAVARLWRRCFPAQAATSHVRCSRRDAGNYTRDACATPRTPLGLISPLTSAADPGSALAAPSAQRARPCGSASHRNKSPPRQIPGAGCTPCPNAPASDSHSPSPRSIAPA